MNIKWYKDNTRDLIHSYVIISIWHVNGLPTFIKYDDAHYFKHKLNLVNRLKYLQEEHEKEYPNIEIHVFSKLGNRVIAIAK